MHELDATLRSRHTWGATTPYHLRPCFPTTPVFKSEVQHCGGFVGCGSEVGVCSVGSERCGVRYSAVRACVFRGDNEPAYWFHLGMNPLTHRPCSHGRV